MINVFDLTAKALTTKEKLSCFYLHSVCGQMFCLQSFCLDFHCLLLPSSSSNMNLILPTNSHDL